jgi:RHH-type proline utilization regulon transcriptional repressor/proline dehydrogenase/delta 1-pyrroline-5-carboxylate dehydrogenase
LRGSSGDSPSHSARNGADLPWPIAVATDFSDERSLHARLVAWAANLATERMARQFVIGSTAEEAIAAVARMWQRRMASTLDILGEDVTTDEAADETCRRYIELLEHLCRAAGGWEPMAILDEAPNGRLPRANVSVKLTALSARFSSNGVSPDLDDVARLLRRIMRVARAGGACINVDMEHYVLRDATLEVFRRVLTEPEFRDWPDVGIVVQAYLRDSRRDLDAVLALARQRETPITIRLVKGAYWDYETERARREGRPSPAWAEKWQTDAHFEELSRRLLESADLLRPAYGSHNVRSIAHALATAEHLRLPPRTIELQMLYGMGDPLKTAVVEMGQRLRVYAPMGAWVPGVAYLVRRLIENTANESFLRQGFAEGVDEAVLLAPPDAISARAMISSGSRGDDND